MRPFLLLSAAFAAATALAGLDEEYRLHCVRMLAGDRPVARRTTAPTDGIAARPDALLDALISDPEGPHVAWARLRPLWFHPLTADLGAPELPADDVRRYREELERFRRDRLWARATKVSEKLAALVAQVLRTEKALGERHFDVFRRGKAAEDVLERERAQAFALYEGIFAKFLELTVMPGTNWSVDGKRPIAALVERCLPNWLALHDLVGTPFRVHLGSGLEASGLTVDAGTVPGLKVLLRTLGKRETPSERKLLLILSPEANFVCDSFNSVFRGDDARPTHVLLAPDDLLSLGGFAPRVAQNRLLLRSAVLIKHKNALPSQARVGEAAIVPTGKTALANVKQALGKAPDQVTRARVFGGAAIAGNLGYGLGMIYGRLALLRATGKALGDFETETLVGTRGALSLAYGATAESILVEEALAMAERAFGRLGDGLGENSAPLLRDETVTIREGFTVAPRVSTLLMGMLPPEQAMGMQRRLYLDGATEGAWLAATQRDRSDEVVQHTIAFYEKKALGVTESRLRVRLLADGFVEILDDQFVVQLPIQGTDMERACRELSARIVGLDAAKVYRTLDEPARRWAWELLQILQRQLYVGRNYAARVGAQVHQVLPRLESYFGAPTVETLAALRGELERIELPKLDRLTLRRRGASAPAAPPSRRTIAGFDSRRQDWKALGAAEREKERPRYVQDAVIADAQAAGWKALNVDPDHEGFDLRVTPPDTEGWRAVEVKSVKAGKRFVTLTEKELKTAIALGARWTLVVGVVDDDGVTHLEYFRGVFEGLEGLATLGLHDAPLSLEALRQSGKGVENPWAE